MQIRLLSTTSLYEVDYKELKLGAKSMIIACNSGLKAFKLVIVLFHVL